MRAARDGRPVPSASASEASPVGDDAAEEIAEALYGFERECMLAEGRCWNEALRLDLIDASGFEWRPDRVAQDPQSRMDARTHGAAPTPWAPFGPMQRENTSVAPRLVRAVIVDDHPAMRAGIGAVLDAAPGLQLVGEASHGRELWPLIERTAPDVIVMDLHLPDEDGLLLCHRIKRRPPAPKVVINSAYADETLVAPAMLAQADALLAKHATSPVLCETLREVVRDPQSPPELAAEQRERLTALLPPEDVALAGLLLLRTPTAELLRITGLDQSEFTERIEDMLRRVSAAYGLPV